MNSRDTEAEKESRSPSDSGEVLAKLFREAETAMDSHDKEEERHREYRKGVKERPVTDKVDGRKMRVSKPA
ncbi:MAG: hypothetical protein PVG99_12370, partial [Desulfobacteraceae bacterium]